MGENTGDLAVQVFTANRVFRTIQAAKIVEAFERFGKDVTVSTPELGVDLPTAANQLFVKMTGPRTHMDIAACSLCQTLPKAGVLLHLPKIDPNTASVTLRLPLESGSVVMDVNAACHLTDRALALGKPKVVESQIAKIA